MGAVPRVGGRLLLVDPDDRVLLIQERTDLVGGTQWITPGGGLEAGETPPQAAVREAYEETGIRVTPDALTPLHRTSRRWTDITSNGATYDQVDHFFAARVPAQAATPTALTALTDLERVTVVGVRWWTLEELHASQDTFEPADVAELVARTLAQARVAGRVLLLDAADRVLLVENYVDIGASSTHWITPGGGAEPGESPAQATVREVREELGLRIELPPGAEPDYTDRELFSFNGHWYDQTNHYYVVRLEPGTPLVAQGVDEIERSVLIGERWWTLAELRESSATIYPVGLADVLQRLLRAERAASA